MEVGVQKQLYYTTDYGEKSNENDSEISEQSAVYMKKILEFSVKCLSWGMRNKMNFKKRTNRQNRKKKQMRTETFFAHWDDNVIA